MNGPSFRPFSSVVVMLLVFSEPEPPVPVDGVDVYTSPAAPSPTGVPFSSCAAIGASGSSSSLFSCYHFRSSKLYNFLGALIGVISLWLLVPTVRLFASAPVPNALDRCPTK
jgi:hypothetical protein